MGTINLLSNYYSLANSSGTSAATTTAQSLAQLLDNNTGTSSTSDSDSSYLLDLSSQAMQYLTGGSSSSTASTNSSDSSSNFTLTAAQQTTITNILDKYKNAPYTQATFDDIQSDLKAAGLDSSTLSAKDQIQSFDPTSVFLSALNGDNTSSLSTPSSIESSESTKASNYMEGIISAWQAISTTYSASADNNNSTSTSA